MGWATAGILAEEAVRLVLADIETEELKRGAAAPGSEAIAVKADTTRQAEGGTFAAQAVERFGIVDVMARMAGVAGAKGAPLKANDAGYEEALAHRSSLAVRIARAAISTKRGGGAASCA